MIFFAASVSVRVSALRTFPARLRRIIGVLALACLLPACSAVKAVYNQAPELAFWYLDGYIDFNGAQSLQVKAELHKLQAWHRRTQLPAYVEVLQRLQRQMPADMAPKQACDMFAEVRSKLLAVSAQTEPTAAALAGTLSAGQMAHLERRFAKNNADYRDEFLDGTPQAQRKKRYQKAVKRAEMLYGSLGEQQLAVLGQIIDQSRFDAALAHTEWLRRQNDVLQTLRALSAGAGSTDQALAAMRGLYQRSIESPDAGYTGYLKALGEDSCKGFSHLHNSTSAEQRKKAVETLKHYEEDLRSLVTHSRT